MSSEQSIWATLGIEPTDDAALIRRAYATRLRSTRPDEDRDGFQRLRAAYEHAIARATRVVTRQSSPSFESVAQLVLPAQAEPMQQTEPARALEPVRVDELEQALRAFVAQLARSGGVDEDTRAALLTLAGALRRAELRAAASAEGEIANLLLDCGPKDTERLDAVVEELGWQQRAERGEASPTIATVVARARDFALLRRLESRSDIYADALRLLREPPKPIRTRWALFWSLRLEAVTAELFYRLHHEFPFALAQMNRESVGWWRRYIEEPRIRSLMLQAWVALPPLLAVVVMFYNIDDASGRGPLYFAGMGMAGAFLFLGGVALGKLWLIDWPRYLIARRALSFGAVTRIDGVWLAVTLGLPVGALFLPGSVGVGIATGGVGVAAVLWIALTSRRIGGDDGFVPFAMAMAMMNGLLALAWFDSLGDWPTDNARTVGIAVTGSVVAHAIGAQRLADWWNVRLSDAERTVVVWVLVVAAALVLAATFLGPRAPTVSALGLAAATVVVLLHRVPVNVALGGEWFYPRGATATAAFMFGAITFESVSDPSDRWMGPVTAGLACGVLASFALVVAKRAYERFATGRARTRP